MVIGHYRSRIDYKIRKPCSTQSLRHRILVSMNLSWVDCILLSRYTSCCDSELPWRHIIAVLLLFQIILGLENSEHRVTQLHVQFTQYSTLFRRTRCRGTLDYWLETVLRISRCLVLVTTSVYAVTAFRYHVRVRNLFEVIIVGSTDFSCNMMMMIAKDPIDYSFWTLPNYTFHVPVIHCTSIPEQISFISSTSWAEKFMKMSRRFDECVPSHWKPLHMWRLATPLYTSASQIKLSFIFEDFLFIFEQVLCFSLIISFYSKLIGIHLFSLFYLNLIRLRMNNYLLWSIFIRGRRTITDLPILCSCWTKKIVHWIIWFEEIWYIYRTKISKNKL